jgi:hypothetical protein
MFVGVRGCVCVCFAPDLIAIDNRRCRDFGLNSWHKARYGLGLPVPRDFSELDQYLMRPDDGTACLRADAVRLSLPHFHVCVYWFAVQNMKRLYDRVEDIEYAVWLRFCLVSTADRRLCTAACSQAE